MRTSFDLIHRFVNSMGKVEKTVATEGWVRPASVELRDGELHYTWAEPCQKLKLRPVMMGRFLKLHIASDDDILKCARDFGALRLRPRDYTGKLRIPDPTSFFDTFQMATESVAEWRGSSKSLGEILQLAAELESRPAASSMHRGSKGEEEQIKEERGRISWQINVGLFNSLITPQIVWDGGGWGIRLRVENLLGALTLQVMLLISRRDGLAICGSCGAIFEAQGKRKVYCDGCGLAAAQRAASKRLYTAKKAARLMHGQGKSLKDISIELRRSIEQVRGWMKSQE